MHLLRVFIIIIVLALLALGIVQIAMPKSTTPSLPPSDQYKVVLTRFDAQAGSASASGAIRAGGQFVDAILLWPDSLAPDQKGESGAPFSRLGDSSSDMVHIWGELIAQCGSGILGAIVNNVMQTKKARRRRRTRG